MMRRCSSLSHAFTLMELLVSIAIVAVLAALLFPVFAQARNMRSAGCLSNHQKIAEALTLYVQDYDSTLRISSPRLLDTYIGKNGITPCPVPLWAGIPRDLEDRDTFFRHDVNHRRNSNPDMLFHNGKIMTSAVTKSIFWGTSWATYTGDKITGMDTWYAGFGGSNYAKTSDEYTGTNGQVGSITTSQGHVIDTSAASGGGNTSTILAEVCKAIPNPDPSGNGYYAVYTDLPRGSAGYCAYHSSGTCNGVPVQFGFFWDLDGDAGCDPQDSSGLHSQGLASLANVSGHELSEARTDPNSGGWYDSSGQENGDKCAWTFGAPLVTFTNGSQWKIQGEWSNNAYNSGTGYPNAAGQKGCLSGL